MTLRRIKLVARLEEIIKISEQIRDLSKQLDQEVTSGQTSQDPDREAKVALAALRRQEIPEATLPGSPDEAKWWDEIRAVGKKVKRSRDADGDKFLRLLKEGQEKSYQAPDSKSWAHVLAQASAGI